MATMCSYFWNWCFIAKEKQENVVITKAEENLQLPLSIMLATFQDLS